PRRSGWVTVGRRFYAGARRCGVRRRVATLEAPADSGSAFKCRYAASALFAGPMQAMNGPAYYRDVATRRIGTSARKKLYPLCRFLAPRVSSADEHAAEKAG